MKHEFSDKEKQNGLYSRRQELDQELKQQLKSMSNVRVLTEDLKIKIGTAYKRPEVDTLDVRGRDLVTGLPKTVQVTSEETEEALKETTAQIIETIHSVLEQTPPELAADIVDNGIYLTGGGALLDGLAEIMQRETGITTHIADDPLECVALGTGKALENLDKLHPGTVYTASNLAD